MEASFESDYGYPAVGDLGRLGVNAREKSHQHATDYDIVNVRNTDVRCGRNRLKRELCCGLGGAASILILESLRRLLSV